MAFIENIRKILEAERAVDMQREIRDTARKNTQERKRRQQEEEEKEFHRKRREQSIAFREESRVGVLISELGNLLGVDVLNFSDHSDSVIDELNWDKKWDGRMLNPTEVARHSIYEVWRLFTMKSLKVKTCPDGTIIFQDRSNVRLERWRANKEEVKGGLEKAFAHPLIIPQKLTVCCSVTRSGSPFAGNG